jgi:hypothetical protein
MQVNGSKVKPRTFEPTTLTITLETVDDVKAIYNVFNHTFVMNAANINRDDRLLVRDVCRDAVAGIARVDDTFEMFDENLEKQFTKGVK